MRLNLHAKVEIALAVMLLLGSCGSSQADWEDKLDVADVNARNAIYRVNGLEDRVSDIEGLADRIDEIESQLNM